MCKAGTAWCGTTFHGIHGWTGGTSPTLCACALRAFRTCGNFCTRSHRVQVSKQTRRVNRVATIELVRDPVCWAGCGLPRVPRDGRAGHCAGGSGAGPRAGHGDRQAPSRVPGPQPGCGRKGQPGIHLAECRDPVRHCRPAHHAGRSVRACPCMRVMLARRVAIQGSHPRQRDAWTCWH